MPAPNRAPEFDIESLRTHLMNWLFTPLFVLWIFSIATGYMATLTYSNKPYDLALLERARALAEHVAAGRGPEALADAAETSGGEGSEHLYYRLATSDGRELAANAGLPRPPALFFDKGGPYFSDGESRGEKVRIVSLHVKTRTDEHARPLVLQLAETTGKRRALASGILGNIVIPQLLLIIMAVGAVWYALKRGLAPLEHLRQEVAHRARDDLGLLDERQAPLEVRPLILAFNDLLGRLKSAMESQQRFVADAAHQLRTPFAGLKTQAELVLREDDPEKVKEALEKILTSAERCTHLVNQLLSLARNEPGGHAYSSFAPLDLGRLAQEAAMHWVPEALKKDIDLGFETPPMSIPVRGDALGLKEMLDNLLDNAIRYTQPGGRVTVSVAYEEGGGVLRVEDDGPGIPPELRDQVFERFYRILGSGQPGSGLGLPIVREVARLHDATVTLEDGENGRGARFVIRFPHHMAGAIPA